jgi:2-oxoglutarate dehydrogenase complex dehydrogenase (E1) component-like enzyme
VGLNGTWFQVEYRSTEATHRVPIRSSDRVLQKGSTLNAGTPVHCQLKLAYWKSQFLLFYHISVLLFSCAAYSSVMKMEAASSSIILVPHQCENLRCHTHIHMLLAPCFFFC